MADKSSRKPVKVGVLAGGGPPPGYRWNVAVLDMAHKEAVEFLDPDQHDHTNDLVKELAKEIDPTHSRTLDVRQVGDCWEIRDKGRVLNKLNVRIFFFVERESRTIVVLGIFNKQNNGPTPPGDRHRMRRRRRLYLEHLQDEAARDTTGQAEPREG